MKYVNFHKIRLFFANFPARARGGARGEAGGGPPGVPLRGGHLRRAQRRERGRGPEARGVLLQHVRGGRRGHLPQAGPRNLRKFTNVLRIKYAYFLRIL